MRAVRLHQQNQPLTDDEVPDPVPGAGELLIDVRAAGICHSDAHYRSGGGRVSLPLTLGHEIAGVVAGVGPGVEGVAAGDRVALHYLVSCGACVECMRNGEQFCSHGRMLGKDLDGGYAEWVVVPARNAVAIPNRVPFDQAAIMMCSTATAWHALKLSGLTPLESLAILGFGGLGISAAQLARTLGATRILAIDVMKEKLALAENLGATPVDASTGDLREALLSATGNRGVDVVLDFAGHTPASLSALRALAPGGRFLVVAINLRSLSLDPYADLLTRERRIIGCSDHTRNELFELMEMARTGQIDLSRAITRRVPLEARAVNEVLDDLEQGTSHLRTVIERQKAEGRGQK